VPRLPFRQKLMLGGRVLTAYVRVRRGLRGVELPVAVARLGAVGEATRRRHPPSRLSRAVDRTLRAAPDDPTCLVRSLVLFRLLREQGDEAQLVIGLPERPATHEAHAWVELDGHVVGPPPGRAGHSEMARFA
jgi:Transglutaminase-like superfamily